MTVTRILSLSNLNKNITRRCWNSRLSVVTLQEKVAMRKVKGAFLTIVMFFSMLVVHASNYYFVPLSKPFDHIAQRLNTLDRENRRSEASPQDLRMLFNLAGNNAQLKARALFWEVRMAQLDKPTETCIKQLKKAEKLCQPAYDYDLALIHYQLAGNYERLGQYLLCYNNCRKAIDVLQRYGDNFFLGNTYLLLVQLFNDIDDNVHAREYLKQAEYYYKQAHFSLNRIYFFQALLTDDTKQKTKWIKKSIACGGNDWALTVQDYIQLSELLLHAGDVKGALMTCNEGDSLNNKHLGGNVYFTTLLSIARAKVYYQRGLYTTTIDIIGHLKPHAAMLHGETFMLDAYYLMWKSYDKLGKQPQAYWALQQYQEQYERNTAIAKAHDIPKAQAREEIMRQNDKLKLVEKDALLKTNYLYLALLAIALVLIAGLALAIYYRQRFRIRKIENEQLRENLKQEALIYAVNRKNFENDIRQKESEISSNTLLLANKNEVLKQISDITQQFSKDGLIPRSYVQQVNRVIERSLKNDDEWQRFKTHFDAVHPNFFLKLKEACPELTENDLRLCAYICIGVRPKQIAEMLSVTPDSVNSNRYRLRKKFGLSRNESLDDFIRKLG